MIPKGGRCLGLASRRASADLSIFPRRNPAGVGSTLTWRPSSSSPRETSRGHALFFPVLLIVPLTSLFCQAAEHEFYYSNGLFSRRDRFFMRHKPLLPYSSGEGWVGCNKKNGQELKLLPIGCETIPVRRQQSKHTGRGVFVLVRVAVGSGVSVMVGVNVLVDVGVNVGVGVHVGVGVRVRVPVGGTGESVAVGVGLGKASSTLKLSVLMPPHALAAVPYHKLTFTTWSCEMPPVLYIFRPSGMMISPGCGLALGPI